MFLAFIVLLLSQKPPRVPLPPGFNPNWHSVPLWFEFALINSPILESLESPQRCQNCLCKYLLTSGAARLCLNTVGGEAVDNQSNLEFSKNPSSLEASPLYRIRIFLTVNPYRPQVQEKLPQFSLILLRQCLKFAINHVTSRNPFSRLNNHSIFNRFSLTWFLDS